MGDPITIGMLAASALSMAAEAALKGVTTEAVKDAYKALTARVTAWASSDLESLKKEPSSKGRQTIIAEILDRQNADDRLNVKVLAETLIAALRISGSVGLDVGYLEALDVEIGNITVSEGVGARIGVAEVQETFRTGDIDVQSTRGKHTR